MKIGRFTFWKYRQHMDETGYVFGVRSYQYGVHNSGVRMEHGRGFVFSVILFDWHLCVDVKLILPPLLAAKKKVASARA